MYADEKPPKKSLLELIVFCSSHKQQEYFNMRKISESDCDEIKTVFFETYCGGYVTDNNDVALLNYLVHLPSQNDFIIDICLKE